MFLSFVLKNERKSERKKTKIKMEKSVSLYHHRQQQQQKKQNKSEILIHRME